MSLKQIEERAEKASKKWMESMAPAIEQAAKEWADTQDDLDLGAYFHVHHPALMWLFYDYLSRALGEAATGWRHIYVQNIIDRGEPDDSR